MDDCKPYSLTVETFISVLKSNEIKIEGGVIHDFLKKCHCVFYDDMYLIILNWFGTDILIGGKYDDWCDIYPLEELDFVVFKNDLYYIEECQEQEIEK